VRRLWISFLVCCQIKVSAVAFVFLLAVYVPVLVSVLGSRWVVGFLGFSGMPMTFVLLFFSICGLLCFLYTLDVNKFYCF